MYRVTAFWFSESQCNVLKAEHLYSALHGIQTTLKRLDMDHTVLPAINTIPAFYLISVHQMAPPPKDERLSWPSWLISSGRFTHTVVTRCVVYMLLYIYL